MRVLPLLILFVGCKPIGVYRNAPVDSSSGDTDDSGETDDGDDDDDDDDDDDQCKQDGTEDCPFLVDAFPFTDSRDTSAAPSNFDTYPNCGGTDHSLGDYVYELTLTERGLLTATIDDVPNEGPDLDVLILSEPDANACIEWDNRSVSEILEPGTYNVVVDSFAGFGLPAGPYNLEIDFAPQGTGPCATTTDILRMYWAECAPGVACTLETDGITRLTLPTVGEVVKEAHLVTVEDDFGGNGWPTSATDGIDEHHTLSADETGYVMIRDQNWAPAGEGGSEYGQGSTGAPLPVIEEAWYVTMFWRDRPSKGTRMIVSNPANGRAVVAAAGYETGPGSNTAIAGVSEEIHDHLGTDHRDTLQIGFAVDQTADFGPIDCN